MSSLSRLPLLSLLVGALTVGCSADNPITPDALVGSSLQVHAGDAQHATVRTDLSAPIVVEVRDRDNTPLRGAEVRAEAMDGGTVAPTTARTNSDGRASFRPTAGSRAGEYRVIFTLNDGERIIGAEARYVATAGAASRLAVGGGEAQIAPVGTALRDTLRAVVTDTDGNPVSGVTVRWSVRSGGGRVTGTTSVSGATGSAPMSWVLGPEAGAQAVDATVGATTLTFHATAVTSTTLVPERLVLVSGNQQSVPAGGTVGALLVVRVLNADGYGVANVPVEWLALDGGSVSPSTPTTTASGQAAALRMVGPAAGTQRTRVTVAGVRDTLIFTHRVAAGRVTQLSVLAAPSERRGAPGTTLSDPVRIQARDSYGNLASGRAVELQFAGARGSASPTAPLTDSTGVASFLWTLGTQSGFDTVTVRLEDATPVRLTALAVATTATELRSAARTTRLGQGLSSGAFRVRAVDALGNGVGNVPITWTVTSGTGTLGAATTVTDAAGLAIASFTPSSLGTIELRATAGALPSVTLSATSGTPTVALVAGSSPQTVIFGGSSGPIALRITDDNDTPLRDVQVDLTAAPAGGQPGVGSRFTTDSTGRVSFAFTPSSQVAGQQTLTLTTGAVTRTVALRLTGPRGEAGIQLVTGGTQTVRSGQAWSAPIVVRAVDPEGAVVSGVRVGFAVASGGGSLPVSQGVTDGTGRVSVTPTAPSSGTTQVITVRLLDAPGTITATGSVDASGEATTLIRTGGHNTSGVVGATLSTPVTVQVLDGTGAPAAGIEIAWSAVGGGSVEPAVSVTDGTGFATTTRRLGPSAGAQGTTATVAGAPTITTTFAHTAVDAVNPASLEIPPGQAGNFQTALAGALLASPIEVVVLNASRQPVPNVLVEFSVATGQGITSSATGGPALVMTDANGRARAQWQLGDLVGTQTVTARAPSFPALGTTTISAVAQDPAAPTGEYRLVVVAGGGQSGSASSVLGTAYRIQVQRAASGTPVSGVTVLLSAMTGGTAGLSTEALGTFTTTATLTTNSVGEVLVWYRTGTWPTDGGGVPLTRSLFSWDVLVTVPSSTTTPPIVVRAFLTSAAP